MHEAPMSQAMAGNAPPPDLNCFRPGPVVHIGGATSGPLAGLRFVAKDLFDVAGFVTGGGNPSWFATHGAADATSPVILQLLDHGSTLIGKTMTDDLACGMFGENAHYGTPLNPRYPDRVPGGSSSGSASAVAAGIADFAIGTDTGGSIRVPASFCEIYGLRPSHGRVSLNGCIPMAPAFDTCGWLARDLDVLWRVGDVLLPDEGDGEPPRFVVAADCLALADAPVRERFNGLFAALGIIERVRLLGEFEPDSIVATFWPLMSRQLWNSNGTWFAREQPVLAPGLKERFIQASQVSAAEVQAADAARRRLTRAMAALLTDDMVVVLPTTHAPPLRRNSPFEAQMQYRGRTLRLVCPASLGRLPQLVIPAVHVDGAHVGLSLLAGFGRDRMLLRAAQELDPRVRAIT
jgi:amidase